MARFIEYQRVTLAELPFHVLGEAFWKPQAAKLWERGRSNQKEGANRVGVRLLDHLRSQWRQEELWVNFSLYGVLAGIPTRTLAAAARILCDGFSVAQAAPYRLRLPGVQISTGLPDFVLRGTDGVVLGEIKIGAKKTSHRYSYRQYRKFMTLGTLCSCLANHPERVCHLLIVPDTNPRKFCSDFERWRPELLGHRLRFRDDGKLKTHVADAVGADLARGEIGLSASRVEKMDGLDVDEIVPTFVYSWHDFTDVLGRCVREAGLDEYVEGIERLEALAYGSA